MNFPVWLAPGLIGFCFGVFTGFIIGIATAFKLSEIEKKSNKK